jgi:hypothetical protein
MERPGRCLVLPMGTPPENPISASWMDASLVASEVHAAISGRAAASILFVGAGSAYHEVQILDHLRHLRSGPVLHVAFLDDTYTTESITNIQKYSKTLTEFHPRPCMLFGVRDAQLWILERVKELQTEHDHILLVIGVNSGLEFESRTELYSWHEFLCTCERLSVEGHLFPGYIKFTKFDGCERVGCERVGESDIWVSKQSFWDMGVEIMASKAARQLLVGCQTA